MPFPEALREALETNLEGVSVKELAETGRQLSLRYRSEDPKVPKLSREDEALAYAALRMPATLEAVKAALVWAGETLPGFSPETLLDAGAGPGTVLWAVREVYPGLVRACLLEREPAMRKMGESLLEHAGDLCEVNWIPADLTRSWEAEPADLVTCAFVLNELPEDEALRVAELLWEHTKGMLLILDPGTPVSHRRIMKIRERLLSLGARLAAPCPCEKACPLGEGDWCHAMVRVQRSALHRAMKSAELSYEDEKFGYLAFTREIPQPVGMRVLNRPQRMKGYMRAKVCGAEGVTEANFTRKKAPEIFKMLTDAVCGDGIPAENTPDP